MAFKRPFKGTRALRIVALVLVVFFAVVFFFAEARAGKDIKKEYLAYNIIKLAKGQKALLVVKSTPALYVINDRLGTQEAYRAISGKAKGDKQRRGDLKTPEGTYFFVESIDGKKLPSRYGVLAVVTDYPNPIDRQAKKTGSGIWLHGTDDPPRLERPRDSKGCVVALDSDVLKIARFIEIGRTPVIVVENLKKGSLENTSRIEKDILGYMLAKGFLKAEEENDLSIFRHKGGFVATVARDTKTARYYIKKNKAGWGLVGRKTQETGSGLQRILDSKEKAGI